MVTANSTHLSCAGQAQFGLTRVLVGSGTFRQKRAVNCVATGKVSFLLRKKNGGNKTSNATHHSGDRESEGNHWAIRISTQLPAVIGPHLALCNKPGHGR